MPDNSPTNDPTNDPAGSDTATGNDGPAVTAPHRVPLTRQQLADGQQDQILEAGSEFLAVLHDIDFHHYSDGSQLYDSVELFGLDDTAATTLANIDRVKAAATQAQTRIEETLGRREWLTSGGPLWCSNCDTDIDPELDDWRVCRDRAEHAGTGRLDCHDADQHNEDQQRTWGDDEQEYEAWCQYWTAEGPRPGDQVQARWADGLTHQGIWTLDPQGRPVITVEQAGQEYPHPPDDADVQVIGLREDDEDHTDNHAEDHAEDGTAVGTGADTVAPVDEPAPPAGYTPLGYDEGLAALGPDSPFLDYLDTGYERYLDERVDEGPAQSWQDYFVEQLEVHRAYGVLSGQDAHLNTHTLTTDLDDADADDVDDHSVHDEDDTCDGTGC